MAYANKQAAFNYINEYQAAAKQSGLSLSAFIMQCVDEKIQSLQREQK